MEEPESVTLGGREYHYIGANGTLARDLYLMMLIRHAGLADAGMLEDETPEDYAERLLDMLLTSGRPLQILGGMIVPKGTKSDEWTEELARATASDLGRISDPAQKKKVQQELLSVVLGFFENGLASWSASVRASAVDGAKASSPKGDGASGAISSASSQTTTPSVVMASYDGT